MDEPTALRLRRPAMSTPLRGSPVLRATAAFGMAGMLSVAPRFLDLHQTGWAALIIYGLAATAAAGGMLVLVKSAAIHKIEDLRTSSRRQLDELARLNLYSEQIGEGLRKALEFRSLPGTDLAPLIDRLLDSASVRASAAFDPTVRFYLVESTIRAHVVKARAGIEPFAIDIGKSCPADRPLDEVAARLAPFHWIAPVSLGRVPTSLVMLSDRELGPSDCNFVEQLALILSLAGNRAGNRTSRRSQSQRRLRAV